MEDSWNVVGLHAATSALSNVPAFSTDALNVTMLAIGAMSALFSVTLLSLNVSAVTASGSAIVTVHVPAPA